MEPGRIGIISRSTELARDVERQLSVYGLGASKIVSVPAQDAIRLDEVLQMFERHGGTDAVLLLGAIGAGEEGPCTESIARMSKPVFGFIDGADADQPQTARLVACGVRMSQDAASIGELVASQVDCPWLPFD